MKALSEGKSPKKTLDEFEGWTFLHDVPSASAAVTIFDRVRLLCSAALFSRIYEHSARGSRLSKRVGSQKFGTFALAEIFIR